MVKEPEDEDGECQASQHPVGRVWTGLRGCTPECLGMVSFLEEIPTQQQRPFASPDALGLFAMG